MSELADALRTVSERIARACDRAGRSRTSVRLVAVSKSVPGPRVREMVACGQALFGENRVQEALEKMPIVGPGASWHLVGHLQRNKARHAVGRFEMIHSVDSVELAGEIDKRCAVAGITQPVLLEINLAREETKAGVHEEDLPALLEAVSSLPHVDLCGLMCIPPPGARAEDSRPFFARLREIRDQAAARGGWPLPELSMGMTDDFEVAVEEGATLVRVGRGLFGERGA